MKAKENNSTEDDIWRCSDPKVGDLIFSYLIKELTEEDAKKFEEHLCKCAKCKSDKIRLDTVISIVRENPANFFGRAPVDQKNRVEHRR